MKNMKIIEKHTKQLTNTEKRLRRCACWKVSGKYLGLLSGAGQAGLGLLLAGPRWLLAGLAGLGWTRTFIDSDEVLRPFTK